MVEIQWVLSQSKLRKSIIHCTRFLKIFRVIICCNFFYVKMLTFLLAKKKKLKTYNKRNEMIGKQLAFRVNERFTRCNKQ